MKRLRSQSGRHLSNHWQGGWGASEYLAVMLGLMVVWRGADTLLRLIREYHDEFSWILMLPF